VGEECVADLGKGCAPTCADRDTNQGCQLLDVTLGRGGA
jgi:hypothetical protein